MTSEVSVHDSVSFFTDFGRLAGYCDLPEAIEYGENSTSLSSGTNSDDLSSLERSKVVEVLDREAGNKTRAAKALGISRRSRYRLIEKYGIEAVSDPSE